MINCRFVDLLIYFRMMIEDCEVGRASTNVSTCLSLLGSTGSTWEDDGTSPSLLWFGSEGYFGSTCSTCSTCSTREDDGTSPSLLWFNLFNLFNLGGRRNESVSTLVQQNQPTSLTNAILLYVRPLSFTGT